MWDVPSVRAQLELFSTHSVVVCAHGAGLMNLILMPPFTAVVEVFPHHTHHILVRAPCVCNVCVGVHVPHSYSSLSTSRLIFVCR